MFSLVEDTGTYVYKLILCASFLRIVLLLRDLLGDLLLVTKRFIVLVAVFEVLVAQISRPCKLREMSKGRA
jgi:hypothetical protein